MSVKIVSKVGLKDSNDVFCSKGNISKVSRQINCHLLINISQENVSYAKVFDHLRTCFISESVREMQLFIIMH